MGGLSAYTYKYLIVFTQVADIHADGDNKKN
jgi:hypothetical protein